MRHLAGGMIQFGCLSSIFCPVSESPEGAAPELLDVHLESAEPMTVISGVDEKEEKEVYRLPCSWLLWFCGVRMEPWSGRDNESSDWEDENSANY